MKKKLGLFIIFIYFFTLSLLFLSCDNGTTNSDYDPKVDYYKTWKLDVIGEEFYIILSPNSVIGKNESYGWEFEVTPITWTQVTNTNVLTKDDYPYGYKITGTVSSHSGASGWETGDDDYGDSWATFIHKDKIRILEQEDDFSSFAEYDIVNP